MKEGIPIEAVIIFNPAAGVKHHRQGQIESAAKVLQDHGWHVEVILTREPGHATEIAKNAKQKELDVVIAAGGDGTLNEALQGLTDTSTALGCLPIGTVNIWANEVKIPGNPAKAAKALAEGQIKTIDVGDVNERKFLVLAGAGFDGDVAMHIHEPGNVRTRKGKTAYAHVILQSIWSYPSHKAKVTIAGEEIDIGLLQAIFQNTQRYTLVKLRPDALVDDGILEAGFYQGKYGRCLIRQFASTLIRQHVTNPFVRVGIEPANALYTRGKNFLIETAKPIAYELDGESAGRSDTIAVSVKPSSLNVLVPTITSHTLFSR